MKLTKKMLPDDRKEIELIAYPEASKHKSPKDTPLTNSQLFLPGENSDRHMASFSGPSAEVFALTEKIRNRSSEIPRTVGGRLDLLFADLRDANLQGADLRYANLQGADLRDANLQGAKLQEAVLIRANLQGADLTDAKLERADLRGANLQGANLQGANLTNANLDKTNLQDTILDLSRYGLPQDFLIDSHLRRLTNNNFRYFFNCVIKKFLEARSQDYMKKDVKDMLNAAERRIFDIKQLDELCENFSSFMSSRYKLPSSSRSPTLVGWVVVAKLKNNSPGLPRTVNGFLDLQGVNLSRANLQGENLQGAVLIRADLEEANLQGANLEEANLEEANLRGANLQGAILTGTCLDVTRYMGNLNVVGVEDFPPRLLYTLTSPDKITLFTCICDALIEINNDVKNKENLTNLQNSISNSQKGQKGTKARQVFFGSRFKRHVLSFMNHDMNQNYYSNTPIQIISHIYEESLHIYMPIDEKCRRAVEMLHEYIYSPESQDHNGRGFTRRKHRKNKKTRVKRH
jgi:uncharacterized protein YjbI with pentapeptide repeats